MRILLILLAILSVSSSVYSQDDPPYTKMSLTTNTVLTFSYLNAQDLYTTKVLPSAIRLELKVKQESTVVSAHVSIPPSSPFADKFKLRLAYTNSQNLVASYSDVGLGSVPTSLLMQPRSTGGTKHYYYLFDLKLDPPTFYNANSITGFSITYTMSLQ